MAILSPGQSISQALPIASATLSKSFHGVTGYMTPAPANVGSNFIYYYRLMGYSSGFLRVDITSPTYTKTKTSGLNTLQFWDFNGNPGFVLEPGDTGTIYLFNASSAASIEEPYMTLSTNPAYNFHLAYNANGGSGAPATDTFAAQNGDNWATGAGSVTVSSVQPTKAGAIFKGWSTSSSATTHSYSGGSGYPFSIYQLTVTLYAVWHYQLSYNANGGVNAPASQTGVGSVTISASRPTKTNAIFLGWSLTSSATTPTYQPSGSITLNSSIILYAIWQYTLSFNKNTTKEVLNMPTSVVGTSPITIPSNIPTCIGNNFLGWATTSVGEPIYDPGDSVTTSSNLVLYAIWETSSNSYIYDGTSWKIAIPYIYQNGEWIISIAHLRDTTWKR